MRSGTAHHHGLEAYRSGVHGKTTTVDWHQHSWISTRKTPPTLCGEDAKFGAPSIKPFSNGVSRVSTQTIGAASFYALRRHD